MPQNRCSNLDKPVDGPKMAPIEPGLAFANYITNKEGDLKMLNRAAFFFTLAIMAYFFGASGVAGVSVFAGNSLLVVFLVLASLSFSTALARSPHPSQLR